MLGTRRELAKAALIQKASHRALGECDAEVLGGLLFEIAATPADHAVRDRVRLRLDDLVEFGELDFA